MEWKNTYRGFLMGTSELVPGVSGGTIAVMLGIYDRLIAAINGVLTREWKRHILFLIPLVLSMGVALYSLSHVMKWLLAHHDRPTYFLFIGLILGILPYLFRESSALSSFRWYHYVYLIIGIILVSFMKPEPTAEEVIVDRNLLIYVQLFFSGVLASAAMILPGVSGSVVFLVLGVYDTIIDAVSNLDLLVILVVGTGIVLGIILMSKMIHYFLTHFRLTTFAIIIGFVIGSIYVIFPGWATNTNELIVTTITFISGLILATILGKVEH